MKIRKIFRYIFTYIGIIALIFFVYSIVDAAYANISNLNDGFFPEVFTYIDNNVNGKFDDDEIPLEGVCFDHMYEIYPVSENVKPINCTDDWYLKTDENGLWISDRLLTKRVCKTFYIVAMPPEGYSSTNTPVDHFCGSEFGFVKDEIEVVNRFLSVTEFARREHLKSLALNGLMFGLVPLISAYFTWWLNRNR